MEFSVFLEEIRRDVEDLCGEEHEVKVQKVWKNNGRTHMGMVFIRRGQSGPVSGPVVYLEPYYESCEDGRMSVSSAADAVFQTAVDCMAKESFMDLAADLMDFEKVKGRIHYHLVNYEGNRELLKEVPFVPYCDLAVVFYIYAGEGEYGHMTVMIRNDYMKLWQTNVEVLYQLAKRNTPRLFPAEVKSIGEILAMIEETGQRSGRREVTDGRKTEEKETFPLYLVTNCEYVYGASVMLYDDILERLAGKLGGDLVILPSSIHEVLVLPYEECLKAGELKKMVRYVNETEVQPEAVLSESVYRYSRATGIISLFQEKGQEQKRETRLRKTAPCLCDREEIAYV